LTFENEFLPSQAKVNNANLLAEMKKVISQHFNRAADGPKLEHHPASKTFRVVR